MTAWIATLALLGALLFAATNLVNAESVPVARAVQLTGTAPAPRPPADGFFVVPPRVVDFRADDDGDRDETEDELESSPTTPTTATQSDLDDDPDDDPDDGADVGSDDD